jgi:hypothetical protein
VIGRSGYPAGFVLSLYYCFGPTRWIRSVHVCWNGLLGYMAHKKLKVIIASARSIGLSGFREPNFCKYHGHTVIIRSCGREHPSSLC